MNFLTRKIKEIDVSLILGSGQADFLEGKVVGKDMLLATVAGAKVLVFTKRRHFYQGYSMKQIAEPIEIAKKYGAKIQILTNASGSVSKKLVPGDTMLIKDHINLMFDCPLSGPEFISMHDCYDPKLRRIAMSCGKFIEGVYAALKGPAYETAAEVRMLKTLGADCVGMSTVPEVISARKLGMRVLAFSLITNRAGMHTSHEDVLKSANKTGEKFKKILKEIICKIIKSL